MHHDAGRQDFAGTAANRSQKFQHVRHFPAARIVPTLPGGKSAPKAPRKRSDMWRENMGHVPRHMHSDEISKLRVRVSFIRLCNAQKASQGDLEGEKKWKVQKQLPHRNGQWVALTEWEAMAQKRFLFSLANSLSCTLGGHARRRSVD
jgi:hypothetical protein